MLWKQKKMRCIAHSNNGEREIFRVQHPTWWWGSSGQWHWGSMQGVVCLPVDRRDRRNIILWTNCLCKESISNLPGEHGWIFSFVFCNGVYNHWGCNFWFWSPNHSSLVAPSLVISRRKQTPIPGLVKLLVIWFSPVYTRYRRYTLLITDSIW